MHVFMPPEIPPPDDERRPTPHAEGNVVDPDVLAERRAQRAGAEQSEPSAARRAADAQMLAAELARERTRLEAERDAARAEAAAAREGADAAIAEARHLQVERDALRDALVEARTGQGGAGSAPVAEPAAELRDEPAGAPPTPPTVSDVSAAARANGSTVVPLAWPGALRRELSAARSAARVAPQPAVLPGAAPLAVPGLASERRLLARRAAQGIVPGAASVTNAEIVRERRGGRAAPVTALALERERSSRLQAQLDNSLAVQRELRTHIAALQRAVHQRVEAERRIELALRRVREELTAANVFAARRAAPAGPEPSGAADLPRAAAGTAAPSALPTPASRAGAADASAPTLPPTPAAEAEAAAPTAPPPAAGTAEERPPAAPADSTAEGASPTPADAADPVAAPAPAPAPAEIAPSPPAGADDVSPPTATDATPSPTAAGAAAPEAAAERPAAPGLDPQRLAAAHERLRAAAPAVELEPLPGGTSAPWLTLALQRLLASEPATAGRIAIGLLPAQGFAAQRSLRYDLLLSGNGCLSVDVEPGTATVVPRSAPRPRSERDLGIAADAAGFAKLLHGRRSLRRPAKVRGARRALRELRRIARAPLGLRDLSGAGVTLDPALALRLVGLAIDPAATRGERFAVAQMPLAGGPTDAWLRIADGEAPTVVRDAPPEPVRLTLRCTRGALLPLIAGVEIPPGEAGTLEGDDEALALLRSWIAQTEHPAA
jgi:hypothetical protein